MRLSSPLAAFGRPFLFGEGKGVFLEPHLPSHYWLNPGVSNAA